MCLDKKWQAWAKAWMNKSEPKIEGTGIAYMLRGDNGASNVDPYATKPTADNQWVVSPAHLMVLFQDQKILDSYPTDPNEWRPLGDVEGYTIRAHHGAGFANEDGDNVFQIATTIVQSAPGSRPEVPTIHPSKTTRHPTAARSWHPLQPGPSTSLLFRPARRRAPLQKPGTAEA